MGAQLNIKSEDAYRLASRLSELTGESLTAVVTKALQAELERQERARDREERCGACGRCGRKFARHCANRCQLSTPAGCTTRTDCPSDRRCSALLAVVLDEPDEPRLRQRLSTRRRLRMSSVNWFEAAMEVDAGGDEFAGKSISTIWCGTSAARSSRSPRNMPIMPASGASCLWAEPSSGQAELRRLPRLWLAKAEREPLLFKGDDFSQTDIEPALKD